MPQKNVKRGILQPKMNKIIGNDVKLIENDTSIFIQITMYIGVHYVSMS